MKLFAKQNKITTDKTHINLVPKDPFYDSLLGKITTWALSIGRYIVIFTELVVILSFLSRFKLDRDVTDLNSAILTRQNTIESYGDLEQNVRDIQRKLDTYNQLKDNKPIKETFDTLVELTPENIQYKDLSIINNSVSITAHADSLSALNRFILNLQATEYFSNVVSENISNQDSRTAGFDFQIDGEIAGLEPSEEDEDN